MDSKLAMLNAMFGDMRVTEKEVDQAVSKSDGITFGASDQDFNVRKAPPPVGKGLVADIIKSAHSDSHIWEAFEKVGYSSSDLQKEKKYRGMSLKTYLGTNFPRPVLEKVHSLLLATRVDLE